jgi:hypothetical protein
MNHSLKLRIFVTGDNCIDPFDFHDKINTDHRRGYNAF